MVEIGEWIGMDYSSNTIQRYRRRLVRRILEVARKEGLRIPAKRMRIPDE
jgi:hypothetical protein